MVQHGLRLGPFFVLFDGSFLTRERFVGSLRVFIISRQAWNQATMRVTAFELEWPLPLHDKCYDAGRAQLTPCTSVHPI